MIIFCKNNSLIGFGAQILAVHNVAQSQKAYHMYTLNLLV